MRLVCQEQRIGKRKEEEAILKGTGWGRGDDRAIRSHLLQKNRILPPQNSSPGEGAMTAVGSEEQVVPASPLFD